MDGLAVRLRSREKNAGAGVDPTLGAEIVGWEERNRLSTGPAKGQFLWEPSHKYCHYPSHKAQADNIMALLVGDLHLVRN